LKGGGVLVSIGTKEASYKLMVESKAEVLEMLNPYLESGAIKDIIDPKGKFKFLEASVWIQFRGEGYVQ